MYTDYSFVPRLLSSRLQTITPNEKETHSSKYGILKNILGHDFCLPMSALPSRFCSLLSRSDYCIYRRPKRVKEPTGNLWTGTYYASLSQLSRPLSQRSSDKTLP